MRDFLQTFAAFFRKPKIGLILAFLLLFRFAEAQLAKLAAPFLLDSPEVGGLALSTGQVGFAYGTIGVIMLTLGGLLGGFLAARNGLKYWLLWMVIAINLPNVVYIFLSSAMPENLLIINLAVGVEQFGYGFGFAAYMLYMLYISNGAAPDRALRDLHRFHGAGHDDSRYVQRLAAGTDRLSVFLYLGAARDPALICRYAVDSAGPFVWPERRRIIVNRVAAGI